MIFDPLAAALGRLEAFRASFSAVELVDQASNLSTGDLDIILARLGRGNKDFVDAEATSAQGLLSSEHPDRLSDSHLAGTHRAMQDGVDDGRKTALGDELERRGQTS
jgi:hypothetical protein